MNGFKHIGPVYDNGNVDTSQVITDDSVLRVIPGDDGFHLKDPVVGNFEWWYFDVIDIQKDILLKIVAHIGTNPLKTSVYPQLAMSVSTPERNEYITRKYEFDDFKGSVESCRIQIKDEFHAWAEHHAHTEYFIMINLPELSARLSFVSEIDGWKPSGDSVRYHKSGRSAHFMWIVPSPKARVDGFFMYKGIRYDMGNAIGYHDHNYCSVDKKRPLHFDSMVKKWFWGKCYFEDYTLIFMDTYFRSTQLKSLFLAKGGEIIHSSNNLLDLKVVDTVYDKKLGTVYPSSLSVSMKADAVSLDAFIDSVKITDRKDLLDEVPPFLKWFIRKFVARPAYYGLFARVTMEMENKKMDGFGNYEYMVFRT